jgi:hypothetical protein
MTSDDRHDTTEPTDPSEPAWTTPPLTPPTPSTPPNHPVADQPVASPGAVAFTGRPGTGPSKVRAGVVASAAVALAVGAVATSLAASPSTSPSGSATPTATVSPSATATADPGTTGSDDAPALEVPLGGLEPRLYSTFVFPGALDGPDVFDGRGGVTHGFADITITAISGSSVTLETDDGWTRTITVDSSTTITKAGETIAPTDLAVGDHIALQQTRNDDGTYTVTAIVVIVPSVTGTVSDLSSSGFKVTTRDGSVWTITTDADTNYHFGTGDGSASDVSNGTTVRVQGESTGENALHATSVQVAGDHVAGTVKAKTDDTITVTTRDGGTVTARLSGDTAYRIPGTDPGSLADVNVGDRIAVDGRLRDDGSIDAATVVAGFPGGHLPGIGGHGWFDWRNDANPDASASPAPSANP